LKFLAFADVPSLGIPYLSDEKTSPPLILGWWGSTVFWTVERVCRRVSWLLVFWRRAAIPKEQQKIGEQ